MIGEFDDGFLSDADTVRSINTKKDPRGQLSLHDQIDQIFDEIDEDSKVERLDNFKISPGPEAPPAISQIPAPGTVLAAKRQYLDNLDRDREGSRNLDSGVQTGARGQTRISDRPGVGPTQRKSQTNVIKREKSGREPDETFVSETGATRHGSAATKCQVGPDHLLSSC